MFSIVDGLIWFCSVGLWTRVDSLILKANVFFYGLLVFETYYFLAGDLVLWMFWASTPSSYFNDSTLSLVAIAITLVAVAPSDRKTTYPKPWRYSLISLCAITSYLSWPIPLEESVLWPRIFIDSYISRSSLFIVLVDLLFCLNNGCVSVFNTAFHAIERDSAATWLGR